MKLRARMKASILSLALPAVFTANASEPTIQHFKQWELESLKDGTRRIYSRGYYAKSRKFGLRVTPECSRRDLIVLWDTYDTGVTQSLKEGEKVTFELAVDDTVLERTFTLEKVQLTRDGIRLLFVKENAEPSLVKRLRRGNEITVKLEGSKNQMRYFDLPSDYFSLTGFTKAYNVSKYLCR